MSERRAKAALAPTVTEAKFLTHVKKLAQMFGWFCYHTRDSRGSDPGFPDLVLVRPPRLIFYELKTARGRLSTDQAAWIQALVDVPGITVGLRRPDDIDAIVEELR